MKPVPHSVSRAVAMLVLAVGLVPLAHAVGSQSPRGALPPKTSDLALPPATSTIYWSVGKDGAVMLSDRPEPGAAHQGVQSFPNHSGADAIARAAREREYWRAQSDAFSARQRERDREQEQRRQAAAAREMASYPTYPVYYAVGGVHRPLDLRGFPPSGILPGPGFGTGAPFVQSPGAAAGQGTAPFLTSGFATGLRR